MTRPILPPRVVAIDPGKRALGWSVWLYGQLAGCGLARVDTTVRDLGEIAGQMVDQVPGGADLAVVERMVQYPSQGRRDSQRVQDAKANDLLDLQAIGAFLAGQLARKAMWITAPEWKGQTPKSVTARRVQTALSEIERVTMDQDQTMVPPSLRHNVVDGVALGLWAHRRLPR